ncbi:unnamed protein product [Rhodiola kirilowii]
MEEDNELSVEIPPYFLCPISLQIMKDPVTAITGITYDRDSIQKWLSNSTNATCPVTNQSLSRNSYLIPNHTLRRLIHVWCSTAASIPTPTPTSVLDKPQLLRVMGCLENGDVETAPFMVSLTRLEALGNGAEMNRVLMARCDVPKLMLELFVRCSTKCLNECLKICLAVLDRVWSIYRPTLYFKTFVDENVIHLVHHLSAAAYNNNLSGLALLALKIVIELTSLNQLQLLEMDFFSKMVKLLSHHRHTTTITVLQILTHLCSVGQNRAKIMEAGAVEALVELELIIPPNQKRTTDLTFRLLSLLCHYVEGRERFLSHPCGLALLAERLLRVSPAVDDRILEMITLISKLCGRKEVVVMEMLQVGVVSKLCMAMQADCADYLKAKARKVLRMHWSCWNGSPCIALYLLTMHHR